MGVHFKMRNPRASGYTKRQTSRTAIKKYFVPLLMFNGWFHLLPLTLLGWTIGGSVPSRNRDFYFFFFFTSSSLRQDCSGAHPVSYPNGSWIFLK